MKRWSQVGTVLVCLSMSSLGLAAPISGVTVKSVSSEYTLFPWDLSAVHVVDGSGLSGGGHAVTSTAGNSWQTITQTGTGDIVFDLGQSYDLASVHVWNLNFYAPYNGRGAKDVEILTSPNASSWVNEGAFLFSMASGLEDDPGFSLDASSWSTARYVQFVIGSNFGSSDNAGHVGLSEVQFFEKSAPVGAAPIPEPATSLLVGAGLLGALRNARRRRSK